MRNRKCIRGRLFNAHSVKSKLPILCIRCFEHCVVQTEKFQQVALSNNFVNLTQLDLTVIIKKMYI